MNYAVIIPARYESSRLPGKPLVMLSGKEMIARTYDRCALACESQRVYVATDDQRVEAVCRKYGIQVIMTSSSCLTGTDRVAECAQVLDSDVFINVQGDEPLFDPNDIAKLVAAAEVSPDIVLNGFCALTSEEQYRSTSVPKVVAAADGRLLYMSRGAIPAAKSGEYIRGWRQVCAYSFPRHALEAFAAQKQKTPLEQIEDIEILRFLELGFQVRMIEMSDVSIPVDNPHDVEIVERVIRGNDEPTNRNS